MNLDPRHLIQLSMIVEAGSFQIAADRLGLTQPGLSRNMAALEKRIGSPVFRRDGRRSIPNALGLRLARHGLAIRAAEDQASALASKAVAGAVGELRIGAPPIVSGRFVSTALSRFINENPGCTVELRTGLVHQLRSMLERGQVDLVIAPQSLADPSAGLDFQPLIDDRVGVMSRAHHPLAQKHSVSIADLEDQSWLAHSRGSLLRQQTEMALMGSGVRQVHVVCETDSIRSVLEIVAATDLITTMPVSTTTPYLEERLVFLHFDHPQFERPLGAIRRLDMLDNPVADQFIQQLVASIPRVAVRPYEG